MTATFLKNHPDGIFEDWPAITVNLVFIIANAIALIPSLLILTSVLYYKRMRTIDNLVVSQIALIDVLYALFTIIWTSLKMVTHQQILTETTCQLEGAVSVVCKVTWLYSATVCAFWRYHNIVNRSQLSRKTMISLQLSQWILPIVCATTIGLTSKFDLMPSGGYCYLAYKPNDPLLLVYYFVNIVVIIVPTGLAIYFYWSITDQFYQIVQKVSDFNSDSGKLANQYLLERDNEKYQHIQDNSSDSYGNQSNNQSIKEAENNVDTNPSLKKYRQVAFRAVMYCSIFVMSFLPYGIAMIIELITDESRSSYVDALVAVTIMAHKILSPVVTLLINAAILAQVKRMVGFQQLDS